jgi:prepilin-type N-terminal cleavage/methylation domain-containing protein
MTPPRSAPGFSLIELLASMSVLTVMCLLLLMFLDQAMTAWRHSERKIDAFREARAALHFLRRDLQSMLVDERIPFYVNETARSSVSLKGNIIPGEANPDVIAEREDILAAAKAGEVQGFAIATVMGGGKGSGWVVSFEIKNTLS